MMIEQLSELGFNLFSKFHPIIAKVLSQTLHSYKILYDILGTKMKLGIQDLNFTSPVHWSGISINTRLAQHHDVFYCDESIIVLP